MAKRLTEEQIQCAYQNWCNGYSQEEIAFRMHIDINKLKRVFKAHKLKKQKPPFIMPENKK